MTTKQQQYAHSLAIARRRSLEVIAHGTRKADGVAVYAVPNGASFALALGQTNGSTSPPIVPTSGTGKGIHGPHEGLDVYYLVISDESVNYSVDVQELGDTVQMHSDS
jgi:hypothetical protein